MSAVTIVAHKPPGRKSLANFTDYHYCIMVVVIIITGVSRGIMYVQLSCSRNR